jgi:glucosamine-6-phosphate deaminase
MQVRVVTVEDFDEMAALEVAAQLALKPSAVLGTATGNTTVGMHEALVRRHRAGLADFGQATLFQIDEYVGVAADSPRSCRGRIESQLSRSVGMAPDRVFFPVADTAAEMDAVCRRYEEAIHGRGGIDLQVLGVGLNGHIGFNEPGSPFGALTRGVAISPGNAHTVAAHDPVPAYGITMGIRTIMNARQVLLLAKGADKAEIVRTALIGPVTEQVPASVLQLHPRLTVLLDAPAASAFAIAR